VKIDLDKIEQQAKRGLADRTEHPMWPISYPLEPSLVLELVQRIRELEKQAEIYRLQLAAHEIGDLALGGGPP
jgi:hypothetical protein